MSTEPLFFQPVFKERIWGGEKLKAFGYDLPYKRTGECWAFAGHPHGQSVVKEGVYKGKTLGALWEKERQLFGELKGGRFPLLTKLLDANDDLSIQVHPPDEYAQQFENDCGKTECWYVVHCEEGAEIVYGHHPKTKEEFSQMVREGRWTELLRKVPVNQGDFYYVPSGTIHAIGKGIVILETQQNSDATYRLYDYERKDHDGKKRDLHVTQSLDVLSTPFVESELAMLKNQIEGVHVTTFVQSPYFTVHKWMVKGSASLCQEEPFLLISVLKGNGHIEKNQKGYAFSVGDHVLLPAGFGSFTISGDAECIVSHV